MTHGNDLLRHTTLADYIHQERDSPVGKLLKAVGAGKVIVVENSEETKYGRLEQQKQLIRMLASQAKGVYNDGALRKVI